MTELRDAVWDAIQAWADAAGELDIDLRASEVDAALDAFAQNRRADDWQPIETAPRDGRDVLVYGPWEGEVSAGDGLPGQYVAARMGGVYYVRGTDQFYGEVAATHWRPLPEGPR